MIAYFNSTSSSKKPLTLTDSNIVIDGNSVVYGATVDHATESFPAVLATLSPFDTNGSVITNLGVNGQTTAQMISNFPVNVVPMKLYGKSNFYLCLEGTNDLYFGGSAEDAYNRLNYLCTIAKFAGFEPFTYTVMPRSNAGTPPDFETKRQALNGFLRAKPFLFGLIDIAADANLGDPGAETNATYFNDLVHPTALGQALIASITHDFLVSL